MSKRAGGYELMLGETLPHDLEAEQSVLAAVLQGGARVMTDVTSGCGLTAGDFYSSQHRAIFGRMEAMAGSGMAIDILRVTEELRRNRELKAAGGERFVGELMGLAPVKNLSRHAAILRNKTELRSLFFCGRLLQERAVAARLDPREIADEAAKFMASHLGSEAPAGGSGKRVQFRTAAELAQETESETEWLCYPWVAAGAITEVGGKVKQAGKTTFVTHMVAAAVNGVPFLNEPVVKTPVVYLTEQTAVTFRVVLERAKLLGREDLAVMHWNQTVGQPWEEIARMAVKECESRGARLLVVDTLTQFAGLEGESENSAGDALRALEPLQEAAGKGLGIVTVRHERKRGGPVGDAARGSSAYGGAVDIVVSIRQPETATVRTMRLLQSVSRFDETPAELMVELTPQGYESRGAPEDVAVGDAMEAIREAAPYYEEDAMTLEELLTATQLQRGTALRAVKELVEEAILLRNGAGHRGAPHRYWKKVAGGVGKVMGDRL